MHSMVFWVLPSPLHGHKALVVIAIFCAHLIFFCGIFNDDHVPLYVLAPFCGLPASSGLKISTGLPLFFIELKALTWKPARAY